VDLLPWNNSTVPGPLVIARRKLVLRLVEVYFADEPKDPHVSGDLVVFLQARTGGERCLPFHTLQLNLETDAARLWAGFSKTTRYEIRRGESRDGLAFSPPRAPTPQDIDEFARFYGGFARSVGVARCNTTKLRGLSACGALAVSRVADIQDAALAFHVYIVTGGRARLLYSASSRRPGSSQEERAAVGRANRALHWVDIQSFQRQAIAMYDFGGLALTDDPRLQAIDGFKRGFGGEVVLEYNCYLARTLLGRVVLAYLDRRSQK
jgi:hypothetical protein